MWSKREKEAYALSMTLPPMTEAQMRYAERHTDSFSYLYYRKEYCSECGSAVKEGRCTGCGRKYTEKDRRRERRSGYYFGIITVCGDYQVIRHFIVTKKAVRGGLPEFDSYECFQNWINGDGKEAVIALRRRPFTFDGWIPWSEMSVRRRYAQYSPYDISDYIVYPWMRVIGRLKRNGFDKRFYGMSPLEFFKALLTDNFVETLVKTGRGWMIGESRLGMLKKFQRELNICHRHGYEIRDISMWLDTVSMCRECGMDTLNPKHVCPEDLQAVHDLAQRRVEAQRRREEERRRRERAQKDLERVEKCEAAYAKAKKKYLGIVLCGGDGIVVKVLQSVREFYEEGEAMHHCVFSNRYYENVDSLVMSARDASGKRLETVEFDIPTGRILQSRGVCNSHTEWHDAIVRLVEANAEAIQAAGRRKPAKKEKIKKTA